jgi:hypothetical protein
MGLEDLCGRLLPVSREQTAWTKMASVLVVARFCEPSSELHIAEDWYRRTALGDLLQLGEEEVNKDRLYRGLDRLLAHKTALEAHLSARCGELFAVENDVLLYDVTSTYFEGQAEANPQAQRGYSRDHRPDCKQVLIALVVTFDGFPLGYEVFAGNTHDAKTFQTIVAAMEARHGALGRVWIADRGMASAENLAWLRQTGRRYIIGAPKSELKKFSAELARRDGWRTVQEGVEVKLARHPDTDETVILCRSDDAAKSGRCTASSAGGSSRGSNASPPALRAQRNRWMRRRLTGRSAASSSKTSAPQPASPSPSSPTPARRAFASASITTPRSTIGPTSRRALISCARTSAIGATDSFGRLTSNSPRRKRRSASRRISSTFVRSGISARRGSRPTSSFASSPSCSGRASRCGNSARASGTRRGPILEELARIQSHDVILPTAAHGEIRLRCAAQPDAAQAALLDRLGVVLPKRMRLPEQELLRLAHTA